MKTTIKAARALVHLMNEGDAEPDQHLGTTTELANALTTEQQALDELLAANKVLVRLIMDEQIHEITHQAVERVNIALGKVHFA